MSSQQKAPDVVDVAIIGAGLSGLTAARDLHRAGCDSLVVLEARDRVGGRTFNHDLGQGVIAEGGGQWIGPIHTAVAELARELGVDTFDSFYAGTGVHLVGDIRTAYDLSQDHAAGSSPVIAELNELARGVPGGAPWQAADAATLDGLSLGDWLTKRGVSREEMYSLGRSASLTFGSTLADLGLLHFLSVVNSAGCSIERLKAMKGGSQEKRFVGGSARLCIEMARMLEDKVILSSPVRKIVGWDRNVVELHTDQQIIRARHVIAALTPALCNQIVFDPPLPAGRAEMQRLWPRTAMRKTVHVYSRPFWREAGLSGQVSQADGPLFWCCDNSPPDGSVGVITAFVKPGSLSHDPGEAERALSAIFAQVLGDEALHPTQFYDIDWSTIDEWSLSCTSPVPPGFYTKWGKFLHPSVGRLIWSGTETADIRAGSMDGAVRAGHLAAGKALQALTRK